MRGNGPRGSAARGAYYVALPTGLAGLVTETSDYSDLYQASATYALDGTVVEASGYTDLYQSSSSSASGGTVLETANVTDSKSAQAFAFATSINAADLQSVKNYVAGSDAAVTESYAATDEFAALVKAAAALVASANSIFITIAAESGVTNAISVTTAETTDSYTAAARAYGLVIGVADEQTAMAATAQALAMYADSSQAHDLKYASSSTDSTGPLRGAVRILAKLRGEAWLEPGTGPKGGKVKH